MASIRSSTQEFSNPDRTRSGRTHAQATGVLDGALKAEQSRLNAQRRKAQAKAAVLVAAVLAVVGLGAKLWPHVAPFVHDLLAAAPTPPPPPVAPAPVAVEPAPAPAPAAKPAPHKHGRKGDKPGKPEAGRTGVADDVMKPSD
jgi:hypothetical protein